MDVSCLARRSGHINTHLIKRYDDHRCEKLVSDISYLSHSVWDRTSRESITSATSISAGCGSDKKVNEARQVGILRVNLECFQSDSCYEQLQSPVSHGC